MFDLAGYSDLLHAVRDGDRRFREGHLWEPWQCALHLERLADADVPDAWLDGDALELAIHYRNNTEIQAAALVTSIALAPRGKDSLAVAGLTNLDSSCLAYRLCPGPALWARNLPAGSIVAVRGRAISATLMEIEEMRVIALWAEH